MRKQLKLENLYKQYAKTLYFYLLRLSGSKHLAVVTGPVKELLKLKDASFVQGEQLGEVELWNWEKKCQE